MKKLTAILLILAMALGLSMAAAETEKAVLFPEGVQMGMDAEAIIALEQQDPYYDASTDTMRDIEFKAQFAGLECMHAYILLDDSLKMVGMYDFADNTAEALAALKEAIAAEYGDPSEVTPEAITKIFTEISGAETPFTFTDGSRWDADENTAAMAFMVSMGGESKCYVIFVSAEYMESIGL